MLKIAALLRINLNKMHKIPFSLLLILFVLTAKAQQPAATSYQKDKESIKALCGCFEVEFKYKETFGYPKDYKLKDPYFNSALEWVSYEEQPDSSIKMQHILIIDDQTIIKHWREDWSYQNNIIYKYDKDYHWNRITLNPSTVKGTWTQKVFEVDDRPQYEGVATFSYFDGNTLWQSKVDAPLPRREYSKRSDYNVLNRYNRLYITDTGYLHEQDNQKIARHDNTADTLVAEEKGYNSYKKVADSKCKAGIEWWEKNKVFWYDVRSVWNELLPAQNDLKVNRVVEDKTLHEKLFTLNIELLKEKKYDSEKAKKEILKTIKEHLVTK